MVTVDATVTAKLDEDLERRLLKGWELNAQRALEAKLGMRSERN